MGFVTRGFGPDGSWLSVAGWHACYMYEAFQLGLSSRVCPPVTFMWLDRWSTGPGG